MIRYLPGMTHRVVPASMPAGAPGDPAIEPSVRIIPLGGLGEIGLNMMLVESGDDLLAVDCGLMFPDDEMPGIDYVIPDFSYLLARREQLPRGRPDPRPRGPHRRAAVPAARARRARSTARRMTLALAGERLARARPPGPGAARAGRAPPGLRRRRLPRGADPRDALDRGRPRLGIETPVGTIVHTGDFKFDPNPLDGERSDYHRLRRARASAGVLVLCSDSTNVDRPGHHAAPSTRSGAALAERVRRAPGRDHRRDVRLARPPHPAGPRPRRRASGARSRCSGGAWRPTCALAAELGYLRVPDGVAPAARGAGRRCPPYRQVILSTGSQGEPNSALALMAAGEHKYVRVERGRSRDPLGARHPRQRAHGQRVINALLRHGAEVLWEDVAFVHVSGHASQDELKLMLNLVRPRYFVPVHGEYRHLLAHAPAGRGGRHPGRARLPHRGRAGARARRRPARACSSAFPARPRAGRRQGRRRRGRRSCSATASSWPRTGWSWSR